MHVVVESWNYIIYSEHRHKIESYCMLKIQGYSQLSELIPYLICFGLSHSTALKEACMPSVQG